MQEFKTSVMMAKMELARNALFFYVLGLLALSSDRQKAILFFSRSKELDGSFQSAYEDYKRAVIDKEKDKKFKLLKWFRTG